MRIGVQTGNVVDILGFEKGYAAIKNAGFDAIDWNLDHAVKWSDLLDGTYMGKSIFEKPIEEVIEYYGEELEVIKKTGLELYQAHAPFPSCVFPNIETLDYMIGIISRNIEYCDYAGIQNLVVHVIQRDWGDTSVTSEYLEELNLKLCTSLIPTLLACKNDVKVCLENSCAWRRKPDGYNECTTDEFSFPEYSVYFIDKLNSIAGKDVFASCYDTGHGNLVKKGPAENIETLGKRLKVLHVHDNDGLIDRHTMPFSGTINWNEFCASLKKTGYDGVICFETFRSHDRGYAFSEEMMLLMLETVAKIGKAFSARIEEE